MGTQSHILPLCAAIDPADTDSLRGVIERPVVIHFWGRDEEVTPRLVGRVFGDGRQLINIYPIMFRPSHFVVRIDSRWSLSYSDENGPDVWLDEVYDVIEDEYPEWPWAKEYGLTSSDDESADCNSRTDFSDGSMWGELDWPLGEGGGR